MKSQALTSAFGGAGFALVLLTLWQGLLVLPPARFFTAPNAQRLFYLHVPSGIMAYLAFMLVVAGSAWWLWQRDQRGDRLARCAAELGVVFGAMSLASGTFWMRAEWGGDIVMRFFSDMRLATTLTMWLLLVAYITWRRQPDSEAVRRGAAARLDIGDELERAGQRRLERAGRHGGEIGLDEHVVDRLGHQLGEPGRLVVAQPGPGVRRHGAESGEPERRGLGEGPRHVVAAGARPAGTVPRDAVQQ